MPIHEVQIIRIQDRQPVAAILCLMQMRHLEAFEQNWKPLLLNSSEADQYWEWRLKYRTYGARLGSESYVIECEGQLQGLMLIETLGYRSWFNPNRRLIYVHSLATAPWNRPSIENPPRYRLVGGTLLEFAQDRSHALGYGGSVGLHSLPGAEDFYRQTGFIECGADAEKENLIYFEHYSQATSPDDNWQDRVDWELSDSENGATGNDL
jgi:hypothetical protein